MFDKKTFLFFLALGLSAGMGVCMAAPDFGPNVLIFDPSMTNIQEKVDAVFYKQEKNQFGLDRYALLFKPGNYNLDVQAGFYSRSLVWENHPTMSPSPAR
jgi:hypothetical protein